MSLFINVKSWLYSHNPMRLKMTQVNEMLLLEFQNWENEATFDDVKLLSKEQLKEYLIAEWNRAKELDEKLTKLTASLAVALTVGGYASKTVTDNAASFSFKYFVIFLFFVSMCHFLTGAWIGFNGLKPKPRYGYGAKYLWLTSKKSETSKKTMIEAVCAFQAMNLIRANEASEATQCMRNGILCFGLAMTLNLVPEQLIQFNNLNPFNWIKTKSNANLICTKPLVEQKYYIFPSSSQKPFTAMFLSENPSLQFLKELEKVNKPLTTN